MNAVGARPGRDGEFNHELLALVPFSDTAAHRRMLASLLNGGIQRPPPVSMVGRRDVRSHMKQASRIPCDVREDDTVLVLQQDPHPAEARRQARVIESPHA